MLLIARRHSILNLVIIVCNLFTNVCSLPIDNLSTAQRKDNIYNQLLHGEPLIIHEETGVVFSRVGYYYDVDDIFALTVTVPVTQYICSILPMEQIDKLSLCLEYQESIRASLRQDEIASHSSISDFLNSTNNTRFSAEKVPTKTHHRHHHRSKRFIPLIVGVAAGALSILFVGGLSIFNTVKTSLLNSRVTEIQQSLVDTNHQLHSSELSILTNTNSTLQLARSFNKAQENMETMRTNVEAIVNHVSRLDSFAEAQTRYNLKTHAERVYNRMKNSIRRIERNDLNLDFVGMVEQNEIFELAYERLKESIPSVSESKATFVSRMLLAQAVQFFPSQNGSHTNDSTGYYPEHLGNMVFTSYFSVLKTNINDKMQVYKITALPFFIIEQETGKEIVGLPKMVGFANTGYIEWRDSSDQSVCDFKDYTICRDPPVVRNRINNMCVEQLISTDRTFHCHLQNSPYSSPHFKKLRPGLMALSTRIPIKCAVTGEFRIFKNLTIVHLNCNDTVYCEGNINLLGDKRCQTLEPYILKTVNDDVVPIVESVRPLNITLPKVYPFATDKNLILTLEEQMKTQNKNIKETEKTGDKLSDQGNLSTTRLTVTIFTVVLIILIIVVLLLTLYTIYRCRRGQEAHPASIVNIGTPMNQPTTSLSHQIKDNSNSLNDLLEAFALNKAQKEKN